MRKPTAIKKANGMETVSLDIGKKPQASFGTWRLRSNIVQRETHTAVVLISHGDAPWQRGNATNSNTLGIPR